MTFYCPACAETSKIAQEYSMQPGTELMTCPACKTEFVVEVQYFEHVEG